MSSSLVTMAYSSGLADAERKLLERLLPEILLPKQQTRPLEWSYREIIDGILYRLKNGCNWADRTCPETSHLIRRCIGTTSSGV
ncbi:transposase [Leptolyngbya iicbica]|uniref:transposase n=1 Tax=Leptolyngbya iicbica TaxID=3161580 RepID=UPI0019138750|nr:transposase [Leptolyngbya sp. LK]